MEAPTHKAECGTNTSTVTGEARCPIPCECPCHLAPLDSVAAKADYDDRMARLDVEGDYQYPAREQALRDTIHTQPRDVQFLMGMLEQERQAHERDNTLNANALDRASTSLSQALRENQALRRDMETATESIKANTRAIQNMAPGPGWVPSEDEFRELVTKRGIRIRNLSTGEVLSPEHVIPYPQCVNHGCPIHPHVL